MVVVVTGGSAGVGRAIARELAARGAHVGLIARSEERLAATVREIEARGSKGLAAPADVADHDQVERAAARIEEALGPIDVWINDAMVTVFAPLSALTPQEVRRVTEVTYLGTVHGTMAALRRMRARDRGHVIQVGSALSYRGLPLQSAYCGAKFAIRGFTDSVRSELLHDRSRVFLTMAQLPALNTPQFSWSRARMHAHPQPVPPIFQPEVAARAIVDVIGHRRREIYIGWPTWKAILGQKLVPGFVDRYLARRGYDAQLAPDEPYDPHRPDNLFEPVDGLWAAHGIFDERAAGYSVQSLLSRAWTRVRGLLETIFRIEPPAPRLTAGSHRIE